MQFAHARDDGLAGFLVGAHTEGRVFLCQAAQGDAHLFLVGLGLRLDGDVDHRLGEDHALENHRRGHLAQGVARGHVLQADHGGDVARPDFLDFFALVGMHLQQTADALLLAANRVKHGVAGLQHAGIDPDERELPDKRVGHQLERERGKLFVVLRITHDFPVVVVDPGNRRNVHGRRQELDDRVEHALHALVLERGAAQHGDDLTGDGTHAQTGDDVGLGEVALLEVFVHQFLGRLGRGLDHLLAPLLAGLDELGRDVLIGKLHALGGLVPDDGLHLDQIDHALEVFLGTDRYHDGHGIGAQAGPHLLVDPEEIGAGAVHLVDERQARHAVLVGLAPHGFGLGLHATHCTIDHAGTIQHAHGALHLDGEVDVPGGIDDVDAMLRQGHVHTLPEAGHGRGRDGDAPLLLLLHPVGRGRTVVHLAELVRLAGVEQDALAGRGLAGIDVRGNPDVAIAFDRSRACHVKYLPVSALG